MTNETIAEEKQYKNVRGSLSDMNSYILITDGMWCRDYDRDKVFKTMKSMMGIHHAKKIPNYQLYMCTDSAWVTDMGTISHKRTDPIALVEVYYGGEYHYEDLFISKKQVEVEDN